MRSHGIAAWRMTNSFLLSFASWVLIGTGMAGTLSASAFATLVHAYPQRSRQRILVVILMGALAATLFLSDR